MIDGYSWYAIVIDSNFTKAYRRRAKNPGDLEDEDFEMSKIKLYADTTDSFIQMAIHQSLLESYQLFVENIAESFHFNKAAVRLPVTIEELFHGNSSSITEGFDLLNNLAPSVIVAIIYTTPLILGAFLVVMERKGDILERTFVSGATFLEVILSHMVTMMVILIAQVILLMLVVFLIFNIKLHGSALETFVLIYLCGLCGCFIGLLLSCISKNPIVALVSTMNCGGSGSHFNVHFLAFLLWLHFPNVDDDGRLLATGVTDQVDPGHILVDALVLSNQVDTARGPAGMVL